MNAQRGDGWPGNRIDTNRDDWPRHWREMVEYVEAHPNTKDATIARRFGTTVVNVRKAREQIARGE
jgi:hypothetical protein